MINMESKMGQLSFIFPLFVFSSLVLCGCSSNVPVLFWGNKGVPSMPAIPAGHSLTPEDFKHGFLGKLSDGTKRNVAVFLQKELSLDDITQNADVYQADSDGGVYHNLKDLMQTLPSGHLPRVQEAGDMISSWQDSFSGPVQHLQAPYNLADLDISEDSSNLIIVHLPDTAASPLTHIDTIIGAVSKALQGYNIPYSAIYTASASSKKPTEQVYFGRHLLEEKESNASKKHIYRNTCVLMYAETIKIRTGNSSFLLPLASSVESTCNKTTVSLTLKFPDTKNTTNVQMVLKFSNTSAGRGYWEMRSWTVNYNDKNASLAVKEIYAPIGHSYHCTDGTVSSKNPKVKVTAKNFQIQTFKIPKGQFGRANDCVGFFTIPILMGLIATFVLVAILTFGLMMLASINTMDRFDDPKGKAITVNVQD